MGGHATANTLQGVSIANTLSPDAPVFLRIVLSPNPETSQVQVPDRVAVDVTRMSAGLVAPRCRPIFRKCLHRDIETG